MYTRLYMFSSMKPHSCGAILYTIANNKVYIILGKEHGEWFPFKGQCERYETYEEAAVREINEETCKLVNVNPRSIKLRCVYSTNRKFYHIALVYVSPNFVKNFYTARKNTTDPHCLEKTAVKMFDINTTQIHKFHNVTRYPMQFYISDLLDIQKKINLSRFMYFKNYLKISPNLEQHAEMVN